MLEIGIALVLISVLPIIVYAAVEKTGLTNPDQPFEKFSRKVYAIVPYSILISPVVCTFFILIFETLLFWSAINLVVVLGFFLSRKFLDTVEPRHQVGNVSGLLLLLYMGTVFGILFELSALTL